MDAKSIFLVDRFVNVRVGEPYLLFPFGSITKNGETVNLTPELAQQFKLPHFKPAIKLGGHADELPAGGHIIGLEVRADGVYAIPEWNDNGTAALDGGAFRYHSPEIIWEGVLLDSLTGNEISAPIIMGDALLHNPALGEATAFYNVERTGGNNMSEMTQIPTSLLDRFMAIFDKEPEAKPTPTPTPPAGDDGNADAYAVEIQEKEAEIAEYKAKVEQMELAQVAAERIAQFSTELKDHAAVSGDSELHTILARLPEADAAVLVTKFKALSAQIDEAGLTGDVGEADGEATTEETIVVLANKYAAEHKVDFNTAVGKLAIDRPELFMEVK